MSDREFYEILVLMMCSDPWPVTDYDKVTDYDNRKIVEAWADKKAQARGYTTWIDAYHGMERTMGGHLAC